MKYDLYIPQTANVFEETDADCGIWLSGFCGSEYDLIETFKTIALTRQNALETDCAIDVILRIYPNGGDSK